MNKTDAGFFSKAMLLLVLSVSSAPAFGSAAGCVPSLFSKIGQEAKGKAVEIVRSHFPRTWQEAKGEAGIVESPFTEKGEGFYRMDGRFLPRSLAMANSRRQQLAISGEYMYFILDGKVAKKSLSEDKWRFFGGLSGAREILFNSKGALLALTESRRVYQLKEILKKDGSAYYHEWSLYKEGIIKMFYNQAGELVFLLGTSKETAAMLAGGAQPGGASPESSAGTDAPAAALPRGAQRAEPALLPGPNADAPAAAQQGGA